ncbi:CHAT domain-containing protein [Hyalangium rubrum]|uniref:CHAT domain-containing protein n=1 Tax=Hyalangium rubrum TaxID=3103134 RepID=A0ABU5GYX3_9BACT|nr:CHAT domain-containing protein [Hyalangium sp. s54d21]MDY7226246.1 CHAT domain-containing protein [Hyalangium sp. s54d21]
MTPTLDERAFIARVEASEPDQFAALLYRPSRDEERALRSYFGDERFERLHTLAVRRSGTRRGFRGAQGNVVVLPGIMGSELSEYSGTHASRIWVNPLGLVGGRIGRLRLDSEGRPEFDVRPSGVVKLFYGELILALSERWNVQTFWYDWRRDLRDSAAALEERLRAWFPEDAPVHLVCHSMGGLVARTFIQAYPQRWRTMLDRDPSQPGAQGGRLIMMGTPNHGSFAALQVITGLESLVRWLSRLDLKHSHVELLSVLNTFVGTFQMLPSPLEMPHLKALYQAATYGDLRIAQARLDLARAHHERLADVVDPKRMHYIAGYNQPTLHGLTRVDQLQSSNAYTVTRAGDGRVPHSLGLLKDVETYFVEAGHAALALDERVQRALEDVLSKGSTTQLTKTLPQLERGSKQDDRRAREELEQEVARQDQEVERLVQHLQARTLRGTTPPYLTKEEVELETLLAGSLLGTPEAPFSQKGPTGAVPQRVRVELRIARGYIQSFEETPGKGQPVDAISVGHYLGVVPQRAERALDEAISRALLERQGRTLTRLPESELLLTQYSERGVLRGDLGQPFFVDDPRSPGRLIVLAGMGVPGRFGMPELTVTVRELFWSLSRMGKKHLATVLIGTGEGNLQVKEAVRAWVRGLQQVTAGANRTLLERITFVEVDADKARLLQEALEAEKERLARDPRLELDFVPLSPQELRRKLRPPAGTEQNEPPPAERNPVPTRVTLALANKIYRFGAITEGAAIPEREVSIDPLLVMQANDELAAERTTAKQLYHGQFLERLLVPPDLRKEFYRHRENPVVLMLDASTARIHWEAIAQSDAEVPSEAIADNAEAAMELFLGTSRGLTRQLRTTFAPPPEPPPPPRRVLRVLVVADPAEDDHLPGAEQEGLEVAELFEQFNRVYTDGPNRVEVVKLFGPHDATRTNVLRHLLMRTEPYDVLHFAGHCVYEEKDPSASGWVFSRAERLTANELKRLDRVPSFVFSNACESGKTPDRADLRSVGLAPTFAESFFERGVSNFVCTAWPVEDHAARQFALTLYAGLLGLAYRNGQYVRGPVLPMHEAMMQARRDIATSSAGTRTWAAYQHYGNPFLRLFEPAGFQEEPKPTRPARAKKTPARTTRQRRGQRTRS